jgi:hypothetical protein
VTFARVSEWAGQACEAVRYIHSKGITHCDLKLENFFLGDGDVVKLGKQRLNCFGPEATLRRWGGGLPCS